MEIESGLDYFPVSTSFLDSDEFFGLTDGEASTETFAMVGRYLALHAYIVGKGPLLEVRPITMRRLARMLGLGADELKDFIALCCECGLLHGGLWESEGILTSERIQSDWVRGKKRGAQREKWSQWSLIDGNVPESIADRNTALASLLNSAPLQSGVTAESYTDISPTYPELSETYPDISEVNSDLSQTYPEMLPAKKIRGNKTKEDKTKEEERDSQESISQVVTEQDIDNDDREPSVATQMPCLAMRIDGKLFPDGEGKPHRTALGALETRYRQRTGKGDFMSFLTKVGTLCPADCCASPEQVTQCHALIADALERYDPSRGSPWALVRRVLTEDRG